MSRREYLKYLVASFKNNKNDKDEDILSKVPKDVLFSIAINLELPEVLRLCESNKRMLKDICNNSDVWINRLGKDYPGYEKMDWKSFPLLSMHPRERYVFLYQLSLIKKILENGDEGEETLKSIHSIFLRVNIDLSDKKLKKIPALNLPNLEILRLFGNMLTKGPELSLLPKLRILEIDNNILEGTLKLDHPNLSYLSASGNKLTSVELNCPKLTLLNLGRNKLSEFPQLDLPNLENLYLYENQLKDVPELNYPKLETLALNGNMIRNIPVLSPLPKSSFTSPKKIKVFLNGNKLTEADKKELERRYKDKFELSF